MNIAKVRIVKTDSWSNSICGNCGQAAMEYLIFLAVISALIVFTAPFFQQMLNATDDTFQFGVHRILNPRP